MIVARAERHLPCSLTSCDCRDWRSDRRAPLAAENLFLRKHVANHVERRVRPNPRTTPRVSLSSCALDSSTLAGRTDETAPKSSPLELKAVVPNYMTPLVPIIQEGEDPFSMFADLHNQYRDWVVKPLVYRDLENLLGSLKRGIIKRAVERHQRASQGFAPSPGKEAP